jgi:hypothetical protein
MYQILFSLPVDHLGAGDFGWRWYRIFCVGTRQSTPLFFLSVFWAARRWSTELRLFRHNFSYCVQNPQRVPHLPRSFAPSKLGGSARDYENLNPTI